MDIGQAVGPLIANLAILLNQEEDAENEEHMFLARLAAEELLELEEEGIDLEDLPGPAWETVTVDIQEYHRMEDRCFHKHFRKRKLVFVNLCGTLYDHLRDQGRIGRNRRPFADIMLMVIWVLATPDSFRSIALRFGVQPGTLYYYYSYVIQALRELAPRYITWPNEEERRTISETFQRASGFPGAIGYIDETHVFVTAPVENAASYRNRHHFYSINVQAVIDYNLLVRDLHVGEVGSMHDLRVFRRSPLRQRLLEGELAIDEHLLGDGGYALTDYMMIPFPNNGHLSPEQRIFNKRLSQCRVRVENGFGKAKGKWRRLKFLAVRNREIMVDHITASFVLHNFLVLN